MAVGSGSWQEAVAVGSGRKQEAVAGSRRHPSSIIGESPLLQLALCFSVNLNDNGVSIV